MRVTSYVQQASEISLHSLRETSQLTPKWIRLLLGRD